MADINVEAMLIAANRNVYGVGTLAYYDAFINGLIPCVVVRVVEESYGCRISRRDAVHVRVTEDRGAYKKGEVLESNGYNVVPRKHVSWGIGTPRINTSYVYRPEGGSK